MPKISGRKRMEERNSPVALTSLGLFAMDVKALLLTPQTETHRDAITAFFTPHLHPPVHLHPLVMMFSQLSCSC